MKYNYIEEREPSFEAGLDLKYSITGNTLLTLDREAGI